MQVVADLHLHSKYSRAVSPQMTLPVMAQVAQQKGLDLLSAADFTHPAWFKEISELLEEAGEGVYQVKVQSEKLKVIKPTYFLLSTEIASIYKHKDKLRRIHNLLFVPSLAVAAKVTAALLKKGANLAADGRPIVGISSRNLLELLLEVDERCFLIPCHIWTPHFGVFGSASGYDSLTDAFEDLAPYVYGIETGLSSDPDMNWSLKELQTRSILSFSDAHSAPKMGRECTVFELEAMNYTSLKKAIMRPSVIANEVKQSYKIRNSLEEIAASPSSAAGPDPRNDNRILYTVEFYPEEGKYHFSGHRACKVSYGPKEIRQKGTVCPVCHRKMTEGVLVRVQQLANEPLSQRLNITSDLGVQWYRDTQQDHPPFVRLVPLLEIVAEGAGLTIGSKKVQNMFMKLLEECGSEMDILLKKPIVEIEKIGGDLACSPRWSSGEAGRQAGRIAEGIEKVRAGNIVIEPGYDGEYGKVKIWREGEKVEEAKKKAQLGFDF
jgi:PHP family Zn ribbon phosphoesterase